MKLMYTFIPIIFLFPSVILFSIVWAYKKKHGLGKDDGGEASDYSAIDLSDYVDGSSTELSDSDAILEADDGAGLFDDSDPIDSIDLSDNVDFTPELGDGELGDLADTGEYDFSIDDSDFVYDPLAHARKRYSHLLLAAILVLITGIIMTVTMYLGIKMTPWSGWWPDWWAS